MKTLCVYCGSNLGKHPDYEKAAQALGQVLINENINLVYGGASVGLMSTVADAVLEGGGEVTGVIPKALLEKEVAHNNLTHLHIVDSMHTRKRMMADLSDGFIAMPGGFGTLEELFEILTWMQLGLIQKPCGLLNVNGYYDALRQFIDHTVDNGFVSNEHRDMLQVHSNPLTLINQLKHYTPPTLKQWVRKEDM